LNIYAPARSAARIRRVLFLCSGNYYRSRFCQELFNARAARRKLGWSAVSRGLLKSPATLNPGPMSTFAIDLLRELGVAPVDHLRLPLEVTEFDFQTTDAVIAVHDPEHRPLIERDWPAHAHTVEYWRVPDVKELEPRAALVRLADHVGDLVLQLGYASQSGARVARASAPSARPAANG
jgi:protein-tyrosine phosphatase